MSSPDSSQADGSRPRRRRRHVLLLAVLLFALLGAAWYAWYLLVGQFHVSTDNAYVHGDRIPVAAQVSGTVVAVYAHDTEHVQRGQVLVKLDPTNAELALARAKAALALQVRQVRQDFARVSQLQATVQMDQAQLTLARDDLARQQRLHREATNSEEQFQQAQTAERVASARLALDQAQLDGARAAVGGADLADNPAVKQAAAAVRNAYLAVQRTRILAPVSGYVADRGVQVGQQVSPSSTLMDVVPLDDVWVDANFKETQLANVRIGQPATVQADFYGSSVTYHGKVLGLSPGTGSAFALLPAQNATGNWIKVVQRLPVRIGLPADQLKKYPLRIGLSMSVDIDTHPGGSGSPLHGSAAVASAGRPNDATDVYARQLAGAHALVADIIAANSGKPAQAHGGD